MPDVAPPPEEEPRGTHTVSMLLEDGREEEEDATVDELEVDPWDEETRAELGRTEVPVPPDDEEGGTGGGGSPVVVTRHAAEDIHSTRPQQARTA